LKIRVTRSETFVGYWLWIQLAGTQTHTLAWWLSWIHKFAGFAIYIASYIPNPSHYVAKAFVFSFIFFLLGQGWQSAAIYFLFIKAVSFQSWKKKIKDDNGQKNQKFTEQQILTMTFMTHFSFGFLARQRTANNKYKYSGRQQTTIYCHVPKSTNTHTHTYTLKKLYNFGKQEK